MMLARGLGLVLVIAAVFGTINDSWSEDEGFAELHPEFEDVELIDTALYNSLSEIVPGVKRNSLEEFIQSGQNHLSVQLDAVNPIIDLTTGDDDFLLAFTVFNPSDNDVKMCIRDTPLEGLLSKLFVVHNPAGKVMEYRGKDVKRDEVPSADEYRTVKAGESISRKVRLSRRYQLDGDGLYYIRVRQPRDGHMKYTDVMRTQTTVFVKGTTEHEDRDKQRQTDRETRAADVLPITDQLAEVSAYKTAKCSGSQQRALKAWHEDARGKIKKAKSCSTDSCSDAIDTWFGKTTSQSSFVQYAAKQFSKMDQVMDKTTYVCQGSEGRSCAKGTVYAYVYPTDTTQQIYICDFTFNYPDYSEKVQTVIHELSHFKHIGDTNDNAYGERTCMNLAQTNYQKAIQTADSVGYFGKYVDQCYPNGPAGYKPKNAPKVGCGDKYGNCPALAKNCDGKVSGGVSISTVCCQSCQTPVTCSGGGSSSSGGGSYSDTRRRAPTPPTSSGGGSSSCTDKDSRQCPNWSTKYNCDGNYGSPINGVLKDYCCKSCGGGGSSPSTPTTTTRRRRYTPKADTDTNCPTYKSRYGCDACCLKGQQSIKDRCPVACA
jgi:hypothetical protein